MSKRRASAARNPAGAAATVARNAARSPDRTASARRARTAAARAGSNGPAARAVPSVRPGALGERLLVLDRRADPGPLEAERGHRD
ncbi:hypothetical protein AB0L25_16605, partial [Spirillospora sp. NPDC052242]